ncbi:MAG: asparagine synthase (glutamine-hydrolyzing) [Candidatus Acidiferrales bacterium]
MCGICGVIGVEHGVEAQEALRRMLASMQHRGPDDEGRLEQPAVWLGMRRLNIIDLAGGSQPVWNETGRVAIVFNGEIYNFRELREVLSDLGHSFRTHSDTEVIVHAYEQWGAECVRRLNGMFAFAIWDGRTEPAQVFLARDRLGIKPLYYANSGGSLVFASEVRALLASGLVERRLSPSALASYLSFGSIAEPETLIAGVFSLPPGYFLHVTGVTLPSAASPKRYWSLAEATANASRQAHLTFADAAKSLRPLLERAVRRHLIADVPLGLFLSSGMDSTCLAALAARERGALHTFTVVFSELEFSEAPMARRTAGKLGAKHQEMLLTADAVLERIDEAVGSLDQPSMDGINTYFVSWAARQVGLKVALSGLGGDEVFGGYGTFRSTPRATRVRTLARGVPKSLRSLAAAAILRTAGGGKRADAIRKGVSVWRSPEALPHAHFFARSLFSPESCIELLRQSSGVLAAGAAEGEARRSWRAWLDDAAHEVEGRDAFTAVSWLEMRSYMVNTLLRDTDAVSMAHSLEVRVPLLDYELVEFVAALPAGAKQRAGQPKALLAEAVRDLLPEEVLSQPKRTFTLPWEHWLRGPLGDRVARDLDDLSAPLNDHLQSKSVRAVWRNFRAGQTGWSRPWSLYVLNEWVRRNVTANPAMASPVAGSRSCAPGGATQVSGTTQVSGAIRGAN